MKQKLLTKMKVLLVAAGLCVGTSASWAATYTTTYNKALTANAEAGIVAWDSGSDISASEWVASNTESKMGLSVDASKGLLFSISNGNTGSNSATKTFNAVPSDGIVQYEVSWRTVRQYGKNGNGNKTYSYIQFGDQFRLSTGFNYYGDQPLYVNYNGTSSTDAQVMSKITSNNIHSIVVKINCKNKEIILFTVDGTDYISKINTTLTGSIFNTLTIGSNKYSANSWDIEMCSLTAAKVSYTANAVNTWNFLDTSVWGNYTSKGKSDNYKESGTGSEVWFAADGSDATSATSNVSFKYETDASRFNYGGSNALGFNKSYNATNDINYTKVIIPSNHFLAVNYYTGSAGRPIEINLDGSAVGSYTASGTYTYTNESENAATLKIYGTNVKNDYSTNSIRQITLVDINNADSNPYIINAVDADGNIIKELASGTAIPYSTYSATGIPYVIKYNNAYYVLTDASSFTKSFTMGEAPQIQNINYTLDASIIGFYEESAAGDNASYSNGAYGTVAAQNKRDRGIAAGTLAPGVYQFEGRLVADGNSGRAITLRESTNDPMVSLIGNNKTRTESVNFVVSSTTGNLYINGANSGTEKTNLSTSFDYIIIRKLTINDNPVVVGDVNNTSDNASSDNYTLKAGETKVFTFQNHGQDFGKNWRINVIENETWKSVTRADSWDEKGINKETGEPTGAATKVAYMVSKDGGATKENLNWDEFKADMANARVEATLAYDLEGKLAITTTSTGAANGYIYYVDQDVEGLAGDLTINLSINNSWLEILSVENTAIAATIPTSGYSSLASAYALDFAKATKTVNAGELTAFVVTEIDNEVTLSSIAQAPANTGVILKGTPGATYTIPVIPSAEAPAKNLLMAAVTATPIEANEAYILQGGLFHKVTAASTVPAGKAYLLAIDVPTKARSLNFVFADNATGIDAVSSESKLQNGEFYNLQGQRVETPTKGLYIVNGTKVIIK